MINPRWYDPAMLRRDRELALKFVRDQGIEICLDETERETAKRILGPISGVFRMELLSSTLSLIYVYDQTRQPPDIARCDGRSSVSERQADGRRVSSIGVSVQALHFSAEYAVMVFLHELTHILYKVPAEHGAEFHERLDALIDRYNRATGSRVKNDYLGL